MIIEVFAFHGRKEGGDCIHEMQGNIKHSLGKEEVLKMKKNLMEATQEWMRLERKTLEQRRQADEFYDDMLLPLVEKDYLKRNQGKVYEKAECFIASVGTSYEPIVLNVKLFSPEKILFLHTEQTESTLNKIVKYCELEADRYEKRKVGETNPLAVFGDLEIEKAFVLFEKHNYAGAQEKLAELKESIPDPDIRQQLNFAYLLAKVYEAWDALDFVPAYENLALLNRQLRRDRGTHQEFLMMDFCGHLERQQEILSYLNDIPALVKEKKSMHILKTKNVIGALMFTMCQNGMIRKQQEKYDMATLLFYRLLEMIEQRRLAQYNLFVSKMEYREIKYNMKNTPEFDGLSMDEQYHLLKQKVMDIKMKVFGKGNGYLPEQVSLLEGFILLYALGDPIVSDKGGNGINQLKRIRAMVFLRNNSIFAHGLGPVGIRDFERFQQFVMELFKGFCKIEKINYDEYQEDMAWVNPMQSRYYTVGKGEV